MNKVFTWAEHHPLGTTGIIIGGGLVLLWLLGAFRPSGGTSNAGDASAAAAYYAAQAATAQSGNALQAAQIGATAATSQALAADQTQLQIQTAWANSANISSTNSANVALADSSNSLALGTIQANDAMYTAINESNNNTALGVTNSNNALYASLAPVEAGIYSTEVAHGYNPYNTVNFTNGSLAVNQNAVANNPNSLAAAGFSENQINNILAGHSNPNSLFGS